MIEQPLWSDDFYFHAQACRSSLQTALCLDEAIRSARDAEAALELGACRIINIKVGRVGGFSEAIAVHDVARAIRCSGLVRRHAGVGHRPLPQCGTLDAFEFQAAGRRVGVEALLEGRHHRARSRGLAAGDHRRQRPAGTRIRSCVQLDRQITVRQETIRS